MMPPCGLRAETKCTFLTACFEMRCVGDCASRARARAYLDSHVLEVVPCILHYFAKTEDGAERICCGIVNARLEVGSGDVGEDVSPKVGRMQKIERRNISKKMSLQDTGGLTQPATTYLVKLNLGYQMLFLTKRVKSSAAFKKAGLKKK